VDGVFACSRDQRCLRASIWVVTCRASGGAGESLATKPRPGGVLGIFLRIREVLSTPWNSGMTLSGEILGMRPRFIPRGLFESVSDLIEREDDLTPSTVQP
jgi:hypothetical protein